MTNLQASTVEGKNSTEWIITYVEKFSKNDSNLESYFNEQTQHLNQQEVSELNLIVGNQVRLLEHLRTPLCPPKTHFYLAAIVLGVVLQLWLSNQLLSLVPMAIALLMACMDWVNTGKYIQGYKHLSLRVESLSKV